MISCYASVYEITGHSAPVYEKDIAVLKKMIASDGKNRTALERIVKMLFTCERFDEVINYSDIYLRNYKNTKVEYLRTVSFANLGKYKEAITAARLILSDASLNAGNRKAIEEKISVYEKSISTGGVPSGAKKTEWGVNAFTAGMLDREKLIVGVWTKTGTPFLYSPGKGVIRKTAGDFYSEGLDRFKLLSVTVSPDGREMFATCDDGNGAVSIIHRRFDINTERWSELSVPEFAGVGTINGFANMLGDGEHLLFVSNRNQQTGLDVYVTLRNASGKWDTPVRVNNINTSMDECSIYVHPDGETVYFSTNGRGGCGGFDLHAGSLSSVKGEFSIDNITNLKQLNTFRNENLPLLVSASVDHAFYTFQRNDDAAIYNALINTGQPSPVLFLDCMIVDAQSREPVRASVRLTRLGDKTSGISMKSVTDTHGRAPFSARARTRYSADVIADGYAFYTESFETSVGSDTMIKTISLDKGKIKTGYTFTADNMYYDSGNARLRAESLPALERLYDFMKNNPGVQIEIAGYTDNVGGYRYNMDLSRKRAMSVAEYLYGRGIKQTRITARGYGYSNAVVSNDTEEGRQKNRRVEITVKSSD